MISRHRILRVETAFVLISLLHSGGVFGADGSPEHEQWCPLKLDTYFSLLTYLFLQVAACFFHLTFSYMLLAATCLLLLVTYFLLLASCYLLLHLTLFFILDSYFLLPVFFVFLPLAFCFSYHLTEVRQGCIFFSWFLYPSYRVLF